SRETGRMGGGSPSPAAATRPEAAGSGAPARRLSLSRAAKARSSSGERFINRFGISWARLSAGGPPRFHGAQAGSPRARAKIAPRGRRDHAGDRDAGRGGGAADGAREGQRPRPGAPGGALGAARRGRGLGGQGPRLDRRRDDLLRRGRPLPTPRRRPR